MKTIATLITALLTTVFASTAAHAAGAGTTPYETRRVVAVGDSITYGVGTYNPDKYAWPVRIGATRAAVPSGCIVTDPCTGGLRPALMTYNRVVLAQRPDVVIVAYGMNDLVWSTPRQIYNGLREVKNRNDARGITTYVATLTPLGERVSGLDPYRVALNDLIRSRFAQWRVIDFDAALTSPAGTLPARYDSGDNLHPNAAAYKVMGRVADEAITPSRR